MGFGYSKQQKKALKDAKDIREDLHRRIENAKILYRESFEEISRQKKQKIMKSSASQLSAMLDENKATSLQILFVFIERTCKVGVQSNYVLDQMFEEAIEEARKCDNIRKIDKWEKKNWKAGRKEQQCYPPFFGVPASYKQSILLKGKQSYAGLVSKMNPIPTEENQFSLMIKNMGLIIFVRTNVPQACKTIETNNNMFGYCLNPWNKERSCGGSSGGQGGMVGSFCSPFGLGSDIGGSLRAPSQFNGVMTIKTGNSRVSKRGNCFYGKFQDGMMIKGDLGPITRSVEDLITYIDYFCDKSHYENIPLHLRDPYASFIPFKYEIFYKKPKLKVGLVKHLQTIKTSNPNVRALMEASQLLTKNDHQLIEVSLPRFQELYHFMVLSFTCDSEMSILRDIGKNQPLTKEFKIFMLLTKVPWIIRKIIIWMIRKKQPRLARVIHNSRPISKKELIEQTYVAETQIPRLIYEVFAKNKLDAIIMPNFVTPAPKLGTVGKLQYCFSYLSSWNVLKYPAGCLPITVVRENQLEYEDSYNDFYSKNIRSTLKGAEGLPVGVQVISTPFNEEKVLYLMNQIEEGAKFRQKFCPPEAIL